jgi:hypothetical protein
MLLTPSSFSLPILGKKDGVEKNDFLLASRPTHTVRPILLVTFVGHVESCTTDKIN